MIKKVLLPICTAILLGLLNWGCHREPIEPTPDIESGGITVEPIVINGEEAGYSLSYRSWIVPGTDAEGNKAPAPPKNVYNDANYDGTQGDAMTPKVAYNAKGNSANDTVSVILHDEFYHVDTVGYVTNWLPDKYANGSYSCHWDKYAVPRAPENYVTIVDSTSILRIQFEEFSFKYCIKFEVATYDNGAIRKQMPHYTPVITDLGIQGEPEVLETICRNDSVFARRVLHHAIRVAVGNKVQTLNAKVTLYRYMPNANPNKFIVKSEITSGITETYIPTDSLAEGYPKIKYNYNLKIHWSNGEVQDSLAKRTFFLYVERENLYTLDHAPTVSFDEMQSYTYSHTTYSDGHVYFHYNGTPYTPSFRFYPNEVTYSYFVYDDGYTVFHLDPPSCSMEYSRTRYVSIYDVNYLYTYANIVVNNVPRQELCAFICYNM